MEEDIELLKNAKKELDNGKGITGFIDICIRNILKRTEKKVKPFERELDFQYNLTLELKNILKKIDVDNIQIHVEYNELNYCFGIDKRIENQKIRATEFWSSDIVIEFNKKYYIIELKCGDTNGTFGTNLSTIWDGLKEDKDKIQQLIDKYENIYSGHCILLTMTSEKSHPKIKNTLKPDGEWRDIGELSYYIEEIKRK